MSGPYECETWPKCSHPCLREGEVIVSVERLAAALHAGGWVNDPKGCTHSRGWTDLDTGEARHATIGWTECQWFHEHRDMAESIAAALRDGGER